jgi:hypothetical protein
MNSVEIQARWQQMVLFTGKFDSLGVMMGLSVGVGVAANHFLGANASSSVALPWTVASACGVALVPWVALAFERFDVAANRSD